MLEGIKGVSIMELFDGKYDDEGMEIFIGNLPGKTTVYDIEGLLGEHAADGILKFSNRLFIDGSAINFCVASFNSRMKGEKAMRALQHKKLGGEPLKIHEFYDRYYHNNRRSNPYSSVDENDKRNGDRRREEMFVLQSMM